MRIQLELSSDYSPASELFARLRKTMTGNNPKLDLVNFHAHKNIWSDSVNLFSRYFGQRK